MIAMPVSERENAYISPSDGPCEAHGLPAKSLARWLVETARARHPQGVDVCVECLDRAREDARWISGWKGP